MAVFAISFRIGDVSNHQARYKSLTERIVAIADGYTSEETTSFYLIKSDLSAAELQSDLYLKTEFNNEYDLLIVIDLSSREYSFKGKFKYEPLLKGLLDQR